MLLSIEYVSVDAILDLRHRVLRNGLPLETAHFSGDTDPTTWHFGAFIVGEHDVARRSPICCASFMWAAFEGEDARQLRGMATLHEYRGQGVGKKLLECAENIIGTLRGPRLLWCNARLPAVPFYKKSGWRCVSETFEIPDAGPHRSMIKRI